MTKCHPEFSVQIALLRAFTEQTRFEHKINSILVENLESTFLECRNRKSI